LRRAWIVKVGIDSISSINWAVVGLPQATLRHGTNCKDLFSVKLGVSRLYGPDTNSGSIASQTQGDTRVEKVSEF
ncbi:MAG TPA: hypothetical protein VF772_04155, partial [Terriglobales bacterium]